jgi:hypothetical protein
MLLNPDIGKIGVTVFSSDSNYYDASYELAAQPRVMAPTFHCASRAGYRITNGLGTSVAVEIHTLFTCM